jgi:hypothetical protein
MGAGRKARARTPLLRVYIDVGIAMKDLESRLAALESSNRRLKTALALLVTFVALIALVGFSQDQVQDVVKAKKFQLIGPNGKILAVMEPYEGKGSVTTYDEEGDILTDLVATKSGAGGIVIYDGEGHQNMVVSDVTGGGGSLVINNSSFKKVVELGHNEAAAGAFTVYNKDGSKIVYATGDTDHAGAVLTYNSSSGQTARMPN